MMVNLEWAVQVLGKAWRNTVDNKEDCTLKNSKLMEDLVVHPILQSTLCGLLEGVSCFGVEHINEGD